MPIVTIQVTREGTTPGATPRSSIGLVGRVAVPLGLTRLASLGIPEAFRMACRNSLPRL
jgi:hypothetical protein